MMIWMNSQDSRVKNARHWKEGDDSNCGDIVEREMGPFVYVLAAIITTVAWTLGVIQIRNFQRRYCYKIMNKFSIQENMHGF